MRVGLSIGPIPSAERALIADYRAAVIGDVPALELSVAAEWKRANDPTGYQGYRANDPTGYQGYRVDTSVAFDQNGRARPTDPVVAGPPEPRWTRSGGPSGPAAPTSPRRTPNVRKRAATSPRLR